MSSGTLIQDLRNDVSKPHIYRVYHDESKPTKRWLLIGLLFVSEAKSAAVKATLRRYREKENYWGEIHFSSLPKSFNGKYGAKALVARHWLRAYQNGLFQDAYLTILAIDKHSPSYQHDRFSKSFHAYNRFTVMAIKSGIAWHLNHIRAGERIEIHLLSDAMNRASSPDQDMIDNFQDYIPFRIEREMKEEAQYPDVKIVSLKLIESRNDDLMQLTDLLLGATQMALVAQSKRDVKVALGQVVLAWFEDLSKEPWNQKFGMHRKVSLSAFPNENGRFFQPVMKLKDRLFPTLFDQEA